LTPYKLYIGDGRQPLRVAHLMLLQSKDHVDVPQAGPGDICATAKVDEIAFDAVLHDAPEDGNTHLTPLHLPTHLPTGSLATAYGVASPCFIEKIP
jgi:elongation factor G